MSSKKELLDHKSSSIYTTKLVNGNTDWIPEHVNKLYLFVYDLTPLITFPNWLIILHINEEFNIPLNNLPPGLEKLKLNCAKFTYDLDNLPLKLEELILINYTGYLDNLPPNLKTLETGNRFNQPIDNLPLSLEKLVLGADFNQRIDNLPGVQYKSIIEERQKLRRTDLNENRARNGFNEKIKYIGLLTLDMIRCKNFNQPIDNLPFTLKKLSVRGIFNHPIDNLPFSLTDLLIISDEFNHPIDKLPSRIKYLHVESKIFNHSTNCLPPNIDQLYLRSNTFNQYIMQLPKKLSYFEFECPNFTSYINIKKLPKTLEGFNIINNHVLCDKLRELKVQCVLNTTQ